jgi:hypothetical protein
MAIGRTVSDLEKGDVLGPVEYRISPFQVREYCHSVEIHQEFFQGGRDQIVTPLLVHLDKLRLYRHACPQGTGPHARVHIEYDATYHEEVKAGELIRVVGTITDRFIKRGRDYLILDMTWHRVSDNKLLVEYRDTVILAFKPSGDDKKGSH